MHTRSNLPAALWPALLLLGLLFGGGLVLALSESLGFYAPLGERGLTLKHYFALSHDQELRAAFWLTFWLASAATLLSALAGLAVALTLRELAQRRPVFNLFLQIPLAVPHLAMAVVVINFIAPSGLLARFGYALGWVSEPADFPALVNDRYGCGIVLTYVLKETPFIALMCLAVLARVGEEYEAVARTLGASSWQRLRYVTLPLVAPALVSATLLVFAFLFGAFEVPFLLGRQYPAMLAVVAQRRYLSVDLADRPGAIAVAVVLAIVTALLVWLYQRLARAAIGVAKPTLF
jgi:putative spermidine/putrescine transport system permease protein